MYTTYNGRDILRAAGAPERLLTPAFNRDEMNRSTLSVVQQHEHRGAKGNMAKFAHAFLTANVAGFEKDMRICLTGVRVNDRSDVTHAYFPALMACCGMLEYLTALYLGQVGTKMGDSKISRYATRHLPQPDYCPDTMRILVDALRHPIAHRSIATGVWVDRHPDFPGRRVVWKVLANTTRPAIALVEEAGEIKRDSPWPCAYTHRVHVHLGRLWRDIAASVPFYLDALDTDAQLLANFERSMRVLYPQ